MHEFMTKIGLMAGVSEVKITPSFAGLSLLGPIIPSAGMHDDLFARVLALDDGKMQA